MVLQLNYYLLQLVYNQRYASVKSVFAVNGNGRATSNRNFDSVDLTQGVGDYSFLIGGIQYPQKPLSTSTNRSAILQELRSAIGSIYDKNNSFSINSAEYSFDGTDANTSMSVPAKFYVGTSCEKLNSNSLLTGVSTQNSAISYRITAGGGIGANPSNVCLIINFDALIEVDLVNRQSSVKA